MIKVQKLQADVLRRLNRINGDFKSHITVVDIDAYLNDAKEVVLENYDKIVEKNKNLSDRLKSLEVKNKKLELISTDNKTTTFKLPIDHYSTLSIYSKGGSKNCNIIEDIFINMIQSHKVEESLRDINTQPNFNWRETFANVDNRGINVYHNNILDIKELYIDYIKWIPDVAYASGVANGLYINADGETITEDKHLLIDDPIIWRKIVAIAEYLIKKDFDENYKATLESIMFNQTVYLN